MAGKKENGKGKKSVGTQTLNREAKEMYQEYKKMGRPTVMTEEVQEEIIMRIAGGESVNSICKDDHMPSKAVVFMSVVDGKHPDFAEKYMIAREAAGFAHADRVASLSDTAVTGAYDETFNAQAIRTAQDGLKWAAERMAPKKHSPRQELTGAGGEAIDVNNQVQVYLPSNGREVNTIEGESRKIEDDSE